MIREATEWKLESGISVGDRIINTIRYAADKVANSQNGLQQLMDNLNGVTREFGMTINVKKTKVMCISRKGSNNHLEIDVDGQQVEQVSQSRYLGIMMDIAQKRFGAELRWQRK